MAQKVMLRVAAPATGDPVPTKYSSAEQKIVDQYTKLGYNVSKDKDGKLQFVKNPNAPKPDNLSETPIPKVQLKVPNQAASNSGRIPLPDYNNPESRLQYAQAFRDKYGKDLLKGYGDIPLRVNEKPAYGSTTTKDMILQTAKKMGVDPAMLYTSSMIEGFSGLYPGARVEGGPNAVAFTGDREYPVSALWHFGLDSLKDRLPNLIKKGYLPADFDKSYKEWTKDGSPAGPQYRAENIMFKNPETGMQAKGAMLRQFYDEFDDYAKNKNIKLTPEQRDYFALAHFNSGAHGYEMLDAYNKAGVLKNNDFINKRPTIPVQGFIDFYKKAGKSDAEATASAEKLHNQIYGNVAPRLAAARGLKSEGLFDENIPNEAAGNAGKVMLNVSK